jgi:hypothetical protein
MKRLAEVSMIRWFIAALALGASAQAQAYCVHNQLKDREITVEQERHSDKLRDERRFRATLKPGQSQCCKFHALDCNPGGRNNSVVNLAIRIPGEPAYECGYPEGAQPNVKVTGAGNVRVMANPRTSSAYPYIVRVRTHDRKDLTGPRGLTCPESKSLPPPKGRP